MGDFEYSLSPSQHERALWMLTQECSIQRKVGGEERPWNAQATVRWCGGRENTMAGFPAVVAIVGYSPSFRSPWIPTMFTLKPRFP